MTLDGANFTASTEVRWEGTSTGIIITSQTPNRIVATIPASLIAAGGLAHVTVFDPGATNDQGPGLLFTIINPVPSFASFSPGGGTAGVSITLSTTTGSNFIPGVTEVIFRDITSVDRPLVTTVNSSTNLTAALPGNLIPVPGNYTWRIRNASPGGGTSAEAAPFVATVATGIDLVMDKSHTGDFTAGTAASYSLRVGNAGSTDSAGTITVTDPLPAGLTFSSAPPINGWTCNFVDPTLTCTNPGPIAAGASSTFTLNVDVDAGAPASVTNSSTMSWGEPLH